MEEKLCIINENAAIADPGPLGLAGFATTTFALSAANAGLFMPKGAEGTWLPLALIFGGSVQLLAGMWEFKKGNTFGASAFSTYGAFWIALALLAMNNAVYLGKDGNVGGAIGFFLVLFTIMTLYYTIATFKLNWALVILFVLLLITFILLDIGFLASPGMIKVGGTLGLVVALVAWYIAAAGVINFTFKKVVLPVGPIK
ncbi:MAG TPA: acetate uptake transporter [Spirochaetia bacterium]|nr:acetate uptake transporter [Spirochaetia bacterium]